MYQQKRWVRGACLGLLLLALLGEKDGVDVGEHTARGDGDARKELVELLVVAHGELDVAGCGVRCAGACVRHAARELRARAAERRTTSAAVSVFVIPGKLLRALALEHTTIPKSLSSECIAVVMTHFIFPNVSPLFHNERGVLFI